jgi:hypothetical protein
MRMWEFVQPRSGVTTADVSIAGCFAASAALVQADVRGRGFAPLIHGYSNIATNVAGLSNPFASRVVCGSAGASPSHLTYSVA